MPTCADSGVSSAGLMTTVHLKCHNTVHTISSITSNHIAKTGPEGRGLVGGAMWLDTHPAASAGATLRVIIATGKFQGVMHAAFVVRGRQLHAVPG